MSDHEEVTIRVLEKPGAHIPIVVYLSTKKEFYVVYHAGEVALVYSGSGLSEKWESEYRDFIASGGRDTFLFRFFLEDMGMKSSTFHLAEAISKIRGPRDEVLQGIARLIANGIF
ncbi:hypothetical protein HMI48_00780 [Acidithiobacillus ferrooxidans]|uniref:hypothetical protein n=1 Tax=Acidithiobacillus ferrooxidans TaxID=920 RepID=UPI001C075857|nr:hypothetical protein [Acidithiobacillus ferrooxidans]MBU2772496.1 hypothetical protein [Acidithiobacillus ferrooxidans]